MKSNQRLIERTISSEIIFSGQLLHVRRDQVSLPNGGKSVREFIKHQGACAVVPFFANGDVMLVRQFRYPVNQIFWEVPAGKIDAGEGPDTTAERELEEETGITAEKLHYVGHFYPGIGYSDEVIHIYTAIDLQVTDTHGDEDEFLELVRLPFDEALQMIETGEINDGKTIICLLRAEMWRKKHLNAGK